MATLRIRKDRTAAMLRKLAKEEVDVRFARRLLAIANARWYDSFWLHLHGPFAA
jgi:hypothetical protein